MIQQNLVEFNTLDIFDAADSIITMELLWGLVASTRLTLPSISE